MMLLKRWAQFVLNVRQHHWTAIPLDHRGLIRVSGEDTTKFLQGLITNDVEFLKSTGAIYSMLLNARGRILYDMLLYNPDHAQTSVLIEVSQSAVNEFLRLLRTYKLRKQVEMENVTSVYRIWSLFSPKTSCSTVITNDDLRESLQMKTRRGLVFSHTDPRHPSLGIRMITHHSTKVETLTDLCQVSTDLSMYKRWLYGNGIAEGVEDIPPGDCIPLEYNIVFLNGVSFNKGCYIGQELVARTHHTGVIRKRLMPIRIDNYQEFNKHFHEKTTDITIINEETKRRAGKLRTSIDQYGIGVVRLNEWKNKLRIENANIYLRPSIPLWWPPLDEATQAEMKLETVQIDSS